MSANQTLVSAGFGAQRGTNHCATAQHKYFYFTRYGSTELRSYFTTSDLATTNDGSTKRLIVTWKCIRSSQLHSERVTSIFYAEGKTRRKYPFGNGERETADSLYIGRRRQSSGSNPRPPAITSHHGGKETQTSNIQQGIRGGIEPTTSCILCEVVNINLAPAMMMRERHAIPNIQWQAFSASGEGDNISPPTHPHSNR